MRPGIKKSPLDYLFALLITAFVMGGAFAVDPPETKWIVFGVGAFMTFTVLVAAAWPVKD